MVNGLGRLPLLIIKFYSLNLVFFIEPGTSIMDTIISIIILFLIVAFLIHNVSKWQATLVYFDFSFFILLIKAQAILIYVARLKQHSYFIA